MFLLKMVRIFFGEKQKTIIILAFIPPHIERSQNEQIKRSPQAWTARNAVKDN